MNWIGGDLRRHSKNKNKAIAQRQKSHFAKVRSNAQHKTGASEHDWNHRSSPEPLSIPSVRPLRNAKRRRVISSKLQPIRDTLRSDYVHDHGADYRPSLPDEIQVRVGSRAFVSQLNTSTVTPSTILPPTRTIYTTSSPMLFDQSYQSQSDHVSLCGSSNLVDPLLDSTLHRVHSQSHRVVEAPLQKHQRHEVLPVISCSPCDHLSSNEHDSSTEIVHGNDPENASGFHSALFDDSMSEAAATHRSVCSTTSEIERYDTDCESHGDFAWRLTQDRPSMRIPKKSALHLIPDALGWTLPISEFPSSGDQSQFRVESNHRPRSSISQSSLPTHLACYTEVEAAKETETVGASKSNRGSEDAMWRKFVFGSGDTACL